MRHGRKIVAIALLALFLLSACSPVFWEDDDEWTVSRSYPDRVKQDGIWVYTQNYIEAYEETLNAMFGSDWSIVNIQERYVEPMEMCDHFDSTPYRYTEWSIQYYDGEGVERIFTLSNCDFLNGQIERHIIKLLSVHFEELVFENSLDGVPLDGGNYVYTFLCKCDVNPQLPENAEWEADTKLYRENLSTPEGTVALFQLSMSNVFNLFPVWLSVHISLDDKNRSNAQLIELEKYVRQQVELIIEDILEQTNHSVNMRVTVCRRSSDPMYDGAHRWRWEYIRGNYVGNYNLYYGRDLYEAYRGVFW